MPPAGTGSTLEAERAARLRAEQALQAAQIRLRDAEEDLQRLTGRIGEMVRARTGELEAALADARTATEAKNRFLAAMSHEIRTPMNGILGTADLLATTGLDREQQQHLVAIRQSGEILMALLNDILDFSKIEAGQLVLEVADFSLQDELDGILRLYRPQAAARGLQFAMRHEGELPERLAGDAIRLRQILSCLVSNAVKFTEQGGVTVLTRCDALPSGRFGLGITVEDTGIGIAPDVRRTLFDLFTQADASMTRRFGGTGLGLAISDRLVRAMGGLITVESVPGAGSVFRASLLLDAPLGQPQPQPRRLPAPGSLRILLVEDNPVNQRLTLNMLGKLGQTADLAENGQVAVARVRATPYDLVLMDVQMPVMDGIEATRCLRSGPVPVRPFIVAMTANAFAEDRAACREAGMDDFISKPFRLARLQDLLCDTAERLAAEGGREHAS